MKNKTFISNLIQDWLKKGFMGVNEMLKVDQEWQQTTTVKK